MKYIKPILALAILGATAYAAYILTAFIPDNMIGSRYAWVPKLWIFPGVIALALIIAAFFLKNSWFRQLVTAISISLVIPVPIFGIDGSVFLPLGWLLLYAELFPLSLLLLTIPSIAIFGILWSMGCIVHFIKNQISNQKLQPTVKTPVESGNEQGTAAEL